MIMINLKVNLIGVRRRRHLDSGGGARDSEMIVPINLNVTATATVRLTHWQALGLSADASSLKLGPGVRAFARVPSRPPLR